MRMSIEKHVEMKQCTKCNEVKPFSDFNKYYGKPRSQCRECDNQYELQRRQSPIRQAKQAMYYSQYKRRQVEKKLGITIPDDLQPYDIAMIQGADECIYCSKELETGEVTVDHVKPFLAKGTNEYSNLLPSCINCNSRKQDKPVYTFLTEINGYSESDYEFKQVVFQLAQRQLKSYDEMLTELKQDANTYFEVKAAEATEKARTIVENGQIPTASGE